MSWHARGVSKLPACGLYRTVAAIGDVPAGRLVYFHNHGEPGPGVYQPQSWTANRAEFSPRGTTVAPDFDGRALHPLPAEGFYRVSAAFYCCPKRCTQFEPDTFVQLGYNGAGKALVFTPELSGTAIAIPERGTPVDDNVLGNLRLLKLPVRRDELAVPRGLILH